MPFTKEGFTLILDRLTDGTDGVNYISVYSDLAEATKQAVTFGTPSTTDSGGSVSASNLPLSFSFQDTETVQAVEIKNGTTGLGTDEVTNVTDDYDYQYVVDTLVISVT